ncbi:hypothetical protein CEQ90_19660 [Lewinellaceae bacterium SD302]|nr:hypothetical protein CEQ90_19660 [Lewinellaceae bacterium SD302]
MKTHYQPFFLVFSLFFSLSLVAQPGGGFGGGQPSLKGNIKGIVLDDSTGEPVEFATVVLLAGNGRTQLDGQITDEKGAFKMTGLNAGKYVVKINFLGYEDLLIEDLETTPKKPDIDLGDIRISTDAVTLETATVTGESALIENRIDKIVYNADQDATNSGGDATDVLRKVPLLSVDLDGNVSLRGSQNLRILVNGRPSTIFASSVAEALKSIPSDQIKSVEVITTPSARYDGEGSGGIINIITKKKEAQGFTGTVNGSIGNRQNNAGLNLNALLGRFGLNGGVNSFWSWRRDGSLEFLREDLDGSGTVIRTIDQGGVNGNRVVGINGNIGAFYDFNAYNSINFTGRYNSFGSYNDSDIDGQLRDLISETTLDFGRTSTTDALRSGFDFTTDYKKTWADKKDKELIFAFQLSGNDSDSENLLDQNGSIPIYQRDINNINDGLNLEYTFQVDYVHPFSEKVKMETGVKSVLRRIESDYTTEVKDSDGAPFVVAPELTDLFNYDQDVYAGFLSFNVNLGEKWGLVAGTRYEITEIGGDFRSENPGFENSYQNLLPSIILNRKLNMFSGLKASYTKRIQRPSLFYINPFTAIADPNNLQIGNPELEPEIVEQYELAYNNYIKGVVINASVYYRQTSDLIESFLDVEDNGIASQTTFLNIGSADNYGFNFFTQATLFKILTLRGNLNLNIYDGTGVVNGEQLNRTANVWNGFGSGSLKMTEKLRIDLFGFFRGQNQTLQGTTPSFGIMSVGLNYDLSKRTTFGIRAVEPFNETKRFPSDLEGSNFRQSSVFNIPFRSIGISFSHKFGQIDFKAQRRNSRVKNDDQKENEGGGQF